jgi:hypothetical protein
MGEHGGVIAVAEGVRAEPNPGAADKGIAADVIQVRAGIHNHADRL